MLTLMAVTVSAQDHVITRKLRAIQEEPAMPSNNPAKKTTRKSKSSSKAVNRHNNTARPTPSISHFCPDNKHPHAIDLGLPSGTKWACCNVGATSPEKYGDAYAWGETNVKKEYSWDTYTGGGFKGKREDTGITICNTKYDVAHMMWGGSWLMPRADECAELRDNCIFTLYTMNGIKGVKVTSKANGKSIFMPATGYRDGTELRNRDYSGLYWSSDKIISILNKAGVFFFHGENADIDLEVERYYGLSVRPVKDSNKPIKTSTTVLNWNQYVDKILLLQKYGGYSNGKEINQHTPFAKNKNEAIILKNEKMLWANSNDGDKEYSYNINSNILYFSNTKEKGWIRLERKENGVIFTVDNNNTYRYFDIYIVCPRCYGDSNIECPSCEGTGNTENDLDDGCNMCDGMGFIKCSKCKGEGVIKY